MSKIKVLINRESRRQQKSITLIASENYVSRDILEALGSVLTNKYSEGYPGKRYYPGNEVYDDIEATVQDLARKLFKLNKNWHVNVQPYSGSPANLAVYTALLEPGDTIMGLKLTHGGHLTHGHKVSITGKLYNSVQYELDFKTDRLDYDAILKLAKKHKPKIIISGHSAIFLISLFPLVAIAKTRPPLAFTS